MKTYTLYAWRNPTPEEIRFGMGVGIIQRLRSDGERCRSGLSGSETGGAWSNFLR